MCMYYRILGACLQLDLSNYVFKDHVVGKYMYVYTMPRVYNDYTAYIYS